MHTAAKEMKFSWYLHFTNEEIKIPHLTWSLSTSSKFPASKMAEVGFELRECDARASLLVIPPSPLCLLHEKGNEIRFCQSLRWTFELSGVPRPKLTWSLSHSQTPSCRMEPDDITVQNHSSI